MSSSSVPDEWVECISRRSADRITCARSLSSSRCAAAREQLAGSGLRLYESLDEALAAGGFEAALIAAPSGLHHDLVDALYDGGRAHVVREAVRASRLRHPARRRSRGGRPVTPLQIGYWRRFVPELHTLHDEIANGALGEIAFIQAWQWDGEPPAAELPPHERRPTARHGRARVRHGALAHRARHSAAGRDRQRRQLGGDLGRGPARERARHREAVGWGSRCDLAGPPLRPWRLLLGRGDRHARLAPLRVHDGNRRRRCVQAGHSSTKSRRSLPASAASRPRPPPPTTPSPPWTAVEVGTAMYSKGART